MASCVSNSVEYPDLYTLNSVTLDSCNEYVVLSVSEYNQLNTNVQVQLGDAGGYFAFGFSLVLFGYLLGYAINVAKTLVNKI